MTYNADKLPKKNLLSMQIDLKKFEWASDEEKAQHETMRESTTFFRDGMRKLRKNPLAMISLVVLICLVLTIVVVPMFYPYSYEQMITVNGKRDKTAKNLAPLTYSKNELKAMEDGTKIFPHIFGTDELCRDYFIRVLYGARVSLAVGLFASLIVLVIGLLYGSISGYFGGKVDMVMMRIVDIIYSLPDTLMVVLLSVVLNQILGASLQGTVLAKVGTNMISLFMVFGVYWGGHGAPGARPDPLHQDQRIRAGRAGHGRQARPHHPPAHPAQLHVGDLHLRGAADPLGHLHRELPLLHRP